jgi:hypothetical protein
MNIPSIVQMLEAEKKRIDEAISALRSLSGPQKSKGKRTMSAAARRKISLAQKRRWAAQKKN